MEAKESTETVFTRENGLGFTRVIIRPIVRKKKYIAEFKIKRGLSIDASVGGSSYEECLHKTESFLQTTLTPEEYLFSDEVFTPSGKQ